MRTSRKKRTRRTGYKKITVLVPRAPKKRKKWGSCKLDDDDIMELEKERRTNLVARFRWMVRHGAPA